MYGDDLLLLREAVEAIRNLTTTVVNCTNIINKKLDEIIENQDKKGRIEFK